MKRAWKRLRHRGEWLVLIVALRVVPLFSRGTCYRIGGALGALAARLDRTGFRVALANLQVAFGDELTLKGRTEVAREAYQHFARTMLDLFWSPRLNTENFGEFIELEGIERMSREAGPQRTCIAGAFHYGNFEWLSLACGWIGFGGHIATQEFKNPLLDDLFRQLRERSGHRTVPRERALVRLYKILRRGGRIALLVDTTLPPHQPTVVIECFGLKTIITVAHAWLQERTGAPLIPMYCEPLPHGRYRVVALPKVDVAPGMTHQQIAQACWDAFEPVVRHNAAPWLWMYKHWRYKPAKSSRPYPFYSQESPAFEQIAANADYAKLDRSRLSGAQAA